MEARVIRHPARHIRFTLARTVEFEPDCPHCPPGVPATIARCPDCDCVMVYRGTGHLRNGTPVHHFECVHSHREVHSVSIVVDED